MQYYDCDVCGKIVINDNRLLWDICGFVCEDCFRQPIKQGEDEEYAKV